MFLFIYPEFCLPGYGKEFLWLISFGKLSAIHYLFKYCSLPLFFPPFPSGISIRDTGCFLHISWGFLFFFFTGYLFIEFLFGSFKNNLVLLLYRLLFHCGFRFSFFKSVIILYILTVLVIFKLLYLYNVFGG